MADVSLAAIMSIKYRQGPGGSCKYQVATKVDFERTLCELEIKACHIMISRTQRRSNNMTTHSFNCTIPLTQRFVLILSPVGWLFVVFRICSKFPETLKPNVSKHPQYRIPSSPTGSIPGRSSTTAHA